MSIPMRRDALRYYSGGKAEFGELRHMVSLASLSMAFPFGSLKGIHDASIWSTYGHFGICTNLGAMAVCLSIGSIEPQGYAYARHSIWYP